MKRKNVCAKLLLLFLCFTLAFAGLVGCKTDELEEKMNAMQNELNGVKEDKAEAEALAELKALVEEVKATADAAATVAKFEEAIAKLESADAANSDALNTAKEELKALIDANADTADAATKAALKEALDKITALEAAAATKEALKTEVDALVAAIDKKADKTALEAAIADLQGKIDANGTADAETKAALQKAITDAIAASEKGDADKLAAAVKTLNSTISANADKAAADLKTAADKAKQDLEDAVAELKAADTTNKAALEAAIDELEAAIAANGSADADTKAALEDLIAANAADDAAALAGAVATLENNIAAKDLENDKALAEAVEDLEAKIAAVDFTDAEELKDAIDAAVAEVNAKIDTKADKTALQNAVAALEDKIAAVDFTDAEELKAAIDAAVAQVNADIAKKADLEYVDAEIGKLNATIKANADAIATLQADVDAAELALAAAEDAIEALEADVDALEADVAELKTAATKNAEDIKAANDAIADLEERVAAIENDTTAAVAIAEIKTAIEALKKADTDNKAAVDKAIADLEAAAATKEALKAAIEALEKADTDNKAAADKAIADLDAAYKAADAGLEAQITAAKSELEGQIAAAKSELEGKIDAVDAKLADLATKAEFTTLQGIVDTLKADVEALKNTNHLDIYEEATKVLVGSKDDTGLVVIVTRDENGKIVSAEAVALGTEGAKEYSLDAFAALKATVKQNEYIPAKYAEFIAECENIEFFLGRAVSPIAIVEYFDKLEAYIAGMPSLIETLTDLLGAKKYVSVDPLDLGAYDENATEDETKTFGIKGTYGLILKQNEGKFPAEYDNLDKTYQALVAAHDNLVAAEAASKAVEDVIEKIGYVVYTADCSAAIEAGWQALYAFEDTYLANSEYTKYYEVEKKELVANYQALSDAHERYVVLGFAADDKVAIINKALNYNLERPLWKDLKALTDNFAEVVAWATEYGIDLAIAEDAPYVIGGTKDAATLKTIYADELDLLQAAIVYATKMTSIYTETKFVGKDNAEIVGVEALNELVDALCGGKTEAQVLWTDKGELDAYFDAYYITLKDEITNYANYDSTVIDKNFDKMWEDVKADFDVVYARMLALQAAYDELEELYEHYTGKTEDGHLNLVGNVTFQDYEDVVALLTDIQRIYAGVKVAGPKFETTEENIKNAAGMDIPVLVVKIVDEGDDNCKAFNDKCAVNALYVTLINEYHRLTAEVRFIYDTVMDKIGDNNQPDANVIPLSFGNIIDWSTTELVKIMNLGVDDVNLVLPGDEEVPVTLKDLYDMLAEVIAVYTDKAEEAEASAKTVAAEIAKLTGYKTTTLNDYDKIKAVNEVLNAWIKAYLGADIKDAGSEAEAIKAIAAVKRFNEDGNYVFVSETDYLNCTNTFAKADELRELAGAEWTDLKATLAEYAAKDWIIHDLDAFKTVDAKFAAYVKAYYDNELADDATGADAVAKIVNAQFDEVNAYNAFAANFKLCSDAVADAKNLAEKITNAIDALPARIDATNYDAVLDAVKLIDADIETYKKDYCNVLTDCIAESYILTLRIKDAVAQLVEYAEAAKTNANAATDEKIQNAVNLQVAVLNKSNDVTKIASALAFAKSQVKTAAPCCVADAAADVHTAKNDAGKFVVDANVDHNCDYCDAVLSTCDDADQDHNCDYCAEVLSTCADAAADGDHACDWCGKADITTCADADGDDDHACDECGKADITKCADAENDGDHVCDECGEVAGECAEGDVVDSKCDECGEDIVANA